MTMKIKRKTIPIRDLVDCYRNGEEEGVEALGGKLNIRPKYQREFVYKGKQQEAVIHTVRKGFPLNAIYWVETGDTGDDEYEYEVLDGQQRTLSICEFFDGSFTIDDEGNKRFFHNLDEEEQNQILDYQLEVYICSGGTNEEKLDWFRTINIAGEKLTEQELRNATYTEPWLSDMKWYFSRTNWGAYKIGRDYMRGSPKRQDYLETVLKWKSDGDIDGHMAKRQNAKDGKAEWVYFEKVIGWTQKLFPIYRKEMKGVDWGTLYNTYSKNTYDPAVLEAEVSKLMQDEDVTKKSGIYTYVFSREEKYLSIRAFTAQQKREAYERQKGICPVDGQKYTIEEMEADHITPWSQGGKTIASNCQMLSKEANRRKSNK